MSAAPDRLRLERIADDPRYQDLTLRRGRFTWLLTGLMLVVYFGYILLIAFDSASLARPIGTGVTSIGIPLGLGVILFAVALTGVYVRRANRDYDRLVDALNQEVDR